MLGYMRLKHVLNNLLSPTKSEKDTNEPFGTGGREVFFVTGVMRSGTTLLQRVVEKSCKIDVTTREFESLNIMVNSFRALVNYQTFQHLSRSEFRLSYEELFDSVLNIYARKVGLNKIVIKDPLALENLAYFHELMPFVKILVSVRNPLSTIASINRVAGRQRQAGQETFISAMDFRQIVDYVRRLCAVIVDARRLPGICIVKYEDLIDGNAAAIENLEDFIGESIELELPDESNQYDEKDAFWTPESGATITASSLNKFQDELSVEQQVFVKNELRSFFETFGYG